MRTGRQSRARTLVFLAAFVVVAGAAAWIVGGKVDLNAAPPNSSPSAATPGPTPEPLNCLSSDLELAGAFNACATTIPDASSTCSVSGHTLEASLRISSGSSGMWLFIDVNGAYTGPATYDLAPWPQPLGATDDDPKVAIQEQGTDAFTQLVNGVPVQQYGTATFWQSVAGILTVTSRDGRSGTLSAILEMSGPGNTTVLGSTLSVSGSWSCP
jgi:hypothetical protein